MSKVPNPKKQNSARRTRPKGVKIPKVIYKKVIKKSRAGVSYTHFVKEVPVSPKGFNRLSRRRLDAWDKKHKKHESK